MIMRASERDIIGRLRQGITGSAPDLVKGIGDDCAVIRRHAGRLGLLTTDTLVESVHFDRTWHPPDMLGRKAASVNISDIAAMGGICRFALLSLAVPTGIDEDWLERFAAGFLAALDEHDVLLIGGDTVRSGHELTISVTVFGEVDEKQVLYRSGAKPGDLIWVSGPLGEAAAGLTLCQRGEAGTGARWRSLVKTHLDPAPQALLGRLLAESGLLHAMMDISDGLATDLAHLCTESKVGAEITAADLPLSEALAGAAAICNCSPLDWALKGGEDYQLLFAAPPENREGVLRLAKEKAGRDISCVGRIVAGSGVTLLTDGKRTDISFQGYDHFR